MRHVVNSLNRSKESRWQKWVFNKLMWWGVPFNRPHSVRVINVTDTSVQAAMKYSKKNTNHIKGIHACAIATVSEYVAGLCLLKAFEPTDYRIIMSSLTAEYHYQAKREITALASLDPEQCSVLKSECEKNDKATQVMVSNVHDVEGNHIATVTTKWQVKLWRNVKLKA